MTIGQLLNIQDYPFEIKDRYNNVIYREENYDQFRSDGTIANHDRRWWRKEFDARGNCILFIDNEGNGVMNEFDESGNNIFTEYMPGRNWIKRKFNEAGNKTVTEDSAGVKCNYNYSEDNKIVKSYCSDGTFKKTTFHLNGKRVFTKVRGDRFWTEEHFNLKNELVELQSPDGVEYFNQNRIDKEQLGIPFIESGIKTDKIFDIKRAGERFNGGLILYEEPTGKAVICAIQDIGESYWHSANEICSKYGGNGSFGWRLPTKDELTLMHSYLFKVGIGEFYRTYWGKSSLNDTDAWVMDFNKGIMYKGDTYAYETHLLRPVKDVILKMDH